MEFVPDHRRWCRHHDDLWTYHVDLRVAFANTGRRMAAVRNGAARWMLVSPVPLDANAAEELAQAGEVDALVVQTAIHNAFVAESCAAFPDATVYFARGTRTARLPQERLRRLPTDLPETWTSATEPIALEGIPRLNEVVLLHKASSTLLVADLCFNLDPRYPLATRLLYRLSGGYPGVRTSRLFRATIRDRRAFLRSFDRILERRFARVVMAHGLVIERDGHDLLRELRRSFG